MCIRDRLDFVLAEIGASAPTDSNTSTTGKDFNHILFTVHLIKAKERLKSSGEIVKAVSYTHLRAHETVLDLVCRLLLEKKTNESIYIAHD